MLNCCNEMLLPLWQPDVKFAELAAKLLTGKELKTKRYFILRSTVQPPIYLVVLLGGGPWRANNAGKTVREGKEPTDRSIKGHGSEKVGILACLLAAPRVAAARPGLAGTTRCHLRAWRLESARITISM